jgi:hypothetical protein
VGTGWFWLILKTDLPPAHAPNDLRILISRDIKNDNWDLDRLLELLEAEVEARERATSNSSAGSSNLHRNPQPKLQGRQLPSGAVLQTGGSTISCTYCQVHTHLIVVKLSQMSQPERTFYEKAVGVSYA